MKHKINALLVEDNELAQLSEKLIIEKFNCLVDIAATGKQALTMAATIRYDLIFMDIGLEEGTDGLIIAETIRKKYILNHDTPIVIISAHKEESYQNKARELGIEGFLSKPIHPEQIRLIITKLFIGKKFMAINA